MEKQKKISTANKNNELEELSLILTNNFETEDFDATEEFLSKCNSIHSCKVCDEVFRTRKDLLGHMNQSYDCRTKRIFRCVECQQIFPTVGEFQLHLLSHSQEKEKPKKKSEDVQFACELCGKDFPSNAQKKKHFDSHFEQRGSVLCPTCGKCLSSKEMFMRHRHTHNYSSANGDNSTRKKLQCKICGKLFGSTSTLRDHLHVHTGEKPYECSFCKKLFSTKGYLRSHLKLHFKSEDQHISWFNNGFNQNQNLHLLLGMYS